MNRLRVLALLALALLIAACSGDSSPQSSPGNVVAAPPPELEVAVELPESAIEQMKALTAEKAARTPAQRKISSQLLYARSHVGAANSIQTVAIAQAPFTEVFAPANPQSAFVCENANGTWTLNVSDNALFDTGTARAFSLVTTGFSCAP